MILPGTLTAKTKHCQRKPKQSQEWLHKQIYNLSTNTQHKQAQNINFVLLNVQVLTNTVVFELSKIIPNKFDVLCLTETPEGFRKVDFLENLETVSSYWKLKKKKKKVEG